VSEEREGVNAHVLADEFDINVAKNVHVRMPQQVALRGDRLLALVDHLSHIRAVVDLGDEQRRRGKNLDGPCTVSRWQGADRHHLEPNRLRIDPRISTNKPLEVLDVAAL
jgi:hypothetical protein